MVVREGESTSSSKINGAKETAERDLWPTAANA